MPGRRIFKITAAPFGSFARCTCAIEAAAKGSRSSSSKHLEGRAAERLLDLRQELVEGDRRHLVMQFCEFGGPRRRQQVLPRREHLAEFDEGRPEFLERKPDALLRFKMSDFARFAPMQDLAGALEQRDDAGATHDIPQPMPDQDRADLAQAWQVPDRAGDAPDHER